jgi:hypothetical protein
MSPVRVQNDAAGALRAGGERRDLRSLDKSVFGFTGASFQNSVTEVSADNLASATG